MTLPPALTSAARRRIRRTSSKQAGDVTVSRVTRGDEEVRVSTLEGPGDRAFLLVAGIGVASDYYVRLALDLNEAGSVHTVDLPGFAGVPHRSNRLGIEDFADHVEAVIADLGLHDPVLVGHSMGAQVVTEVAARRQDISTLILIGPVVNDAERRITQQALRLLACACREPFAITTHVLISYVLCGPFWYFRVLPAMMRYPIEKRLPSVQADTLVLRGEHDGNCPRPWALRLSRAAQHARAWEIPGAAHSVMYAHAHEVARLCLEHLHGPDSSDDEHGIEQHTGESDVTRDPRRAALTYLAQMARGTFASILGMARRDDTLVAEGTRRQVQALAEQRADDPKNPGEPVSLSPEHDG